MQSGIKYNLLLSIFTYLAAVFLISGCIQSSNTGGCSRSCGPHSIVFSGDGTGYLLGYAQLLAINPQGNIIFNKNVPNPLGQTSDLLSISESGNIWEVNDALLILNSQGNFVTQFTTDFDTLTSVAISTSADIGWVGGWSNTGSTMLEALNVSGQSLTSFTLPENPTSLDNEWIMNVVKLAISPADGTIWAWSPGYLSGYSFTGLVYGPYPINLFESSGVYLGCGINEKWIVVNPVTNDIWMGNPATTTVLALSPDGTVQFQKNLDIYVSTMAVSPKTGNVWIGSNNKIDVLDPYGNVIKQLTLKNINCITYIAISPLDDTVWIGNETNMASTDKNIFILDENGSIVKSVYVPVRCFAPCPG